MLEWLYEAYVATIGHTRLLNQISNVHPNNEIVIPQSASIERKTQIYGRVELGERSLVGPDCAIRGDVNIHSDVHVGAGCEIDGDVEVGNGTNLNRENELLGEISIGKYCAIAPRARMRTSDHPTNLAATQMRLHDRIGANKMEHVSDGPIQIGNDVWVCSDAKILSDVTVGDGAVIGADSVVVDDVKPYSVVAGNPATHKKFRFDSRTRKQLEEIRWWDWSIDKMRQNVKFFEADLSNVEDLFDLIET